MRVCVCTYVYIYIDTHTPYLEDDEGPEKLTTTWGSYFARCVFKSFECEHARVHALAKSPAGVGVI